MIIKNPPQLTKEKILSKISELDIFSYYIKSYDPKKKFFSSELRHDKHPSCSLKVTASGVLYHDFGNGFSTDCFGYVMTKYNCTFPEALKIISCDFGLVKVKSGYTPTNIVFGVPNLIKTNEILHIETDIKIKSRKFAKFDYEYWNSYGITNEFLALDKIKAISYYWINNTRFKAEKYAYAYIGGINKFKIYQPFASKKTKWFNNLGKTMLGYDLLPKTGDLLFITSSFKDVGCLWGIDYPAIELGSEHGNIPDLILDDLKERFRRIIIYFNNDKAGIDAAIRLSERTKLPYMFNDSFYPKDPSDLYNKFGRKVLITQITELI